MRIKEIAEHTHVDASDVRRFCSMHEIPRHRKQGERGVLVDVDAYIMALRARKYYSEADALERQREVS